MNNNDSFEDLMRELQECAYVIVEQNRVLLTRLECGDFNPVTELDFTANNAGVLIHRFFEAVAQFEEGKVPIAALGELCSTTDILIDELKKRNDAPVNELDVAGVAFRKAALLWKDNHPKPLMRREVYLKKHFKSEENIKKSLETLHAAYVKKYAAKGRKRKTLSAADALQDNGKKAEERRAIFTEIERLVGLNYSILKAIEMMKNGSYGARMRGVKNETWKRYYLEYTRRKSLRKRAKGGKGETVNRGNETINFKDETINEPVKVQNEPVKVKGEPVNEPVNRKSEPVNEPVNCKSEPVNELVKYEIDETLLQKIRLNPGINRVKLIKDFGLSRSTVSRSLVRLVDRGSVEFRGAPKTGGYYVCQIGTNRSDLVVPKFDSHPHS